MFIRELYEKYRRELRPLINDDILTPEQFEERFGPKLKSMGCVSVNTPSEQGVMYYHLSEKDDRQICTVPVWGYCASSDKVLTGLFTQLSEELVSRKTTHFQVHLYAHDQQALHAFSMMQFGYMAETGIAKCALPCPGRGSSCEIRTLGKDEIPHRWDEIWEMTEAVITHLRRAPVFYPGREFTEEVYKAFFTDETVRLHVAFDNVGRMTGMIETNAEPNKLIRSDVLSVNTGEAYVPADKRGTGLADALFAYAMAYEKERGAGYLWVEHGTANPQARGFWGRYFESYEYELDRTIEQI